jgi:hypothetical protein
MRNNVRHFVRPKWIGVVYLVPLVVFFPPHVTWLHCIWNVDEDVVKFTIWSRVFLCVANSCLTSQERLCILWNRKVKYHVYLFKILLSFYLPIKA